MILFLAGFLFLIAVATVRSCFAIEVAVAVFALFASDPQQGFALTAVAVWTMGRGSVRQSGGCVVGYCR